MKRAQQNLNDLLAFLAVARERSFTRAAAQFGVSQSALSHTIRGLESRMGVRLLTRTTRSVSPTEAGERLMHNLGPLVDGIEAEVASVGELRDKPAGTVRITATDYAANTVLWPKLAPVLRAYPEIKVEISTDYRLTDIVADRFDIGVRLGSEVAKGMIAVRIAPDMRMSIVGSASYLKDHPAPKTPQDLTRHNCINLRLPTYGGLLSWELQNGRRELRVRVEGQVTFSGTYQILAAALDGVGLAYIPEDVAKPHVDARRLEWVLEDWFPTFPGFHVYYPSRRQSSRALGVVIDALRYRA
ncbi:MAG TPA: LysR family transcriptional regulator [Casimicrobiaceae bacterium]|nr:LysR family transcriptional regulator [Casimicrobiaceae bacterium]